MHWKKRWRVKGISMKYVGGHMRIGGGVENAPLHAVAIGAKAFAMFTKNQYQWNAASYTPENVSLFKKYCEDGGYRAAHILPHASYLINLGHPETAGLEKSRQAFIDEMKRCEQLGLCMLNFHPGSSLKKISEEECLTRIAESVNIALEQTKRVCAVVENTAGQGTNMGYTFEQLAFIIEKVRDKKRVGVCLDTCHLFAAGYDVSTSAGFTEVFEHFNDVIGFHYLKGMHLNDSKKGLGSRVDRHEAIGKGMMGMEVFRQIMQDRRFDDIPLILETPDEANWGEEIKVLYHFNRE